MTPGLLARTTPVVLGMLHLAGSDRRDIIDRAVREAEVYRTSGVDGCIVENYFGKPADVEAVLREFASSSPGLLVGVNLLDDDAKGFALATRWGASFLQLDSVAGHLKPELDPAFAADLGAWRAGYGGSVLGGVRFKYQPVNSGNDLATDLRIGAERCDAIVITGDATGEPPAAEKIASFRSVLGDHYPFLLGSGLTQSNAADLLRSTSGAIVGSAFKDTGKDSGEVDAARVRAITTVVSLMAARSEAARG